MGDIITTESMKDAAGDIKHVSSQDSKNNDDTLVSLQNIKFRWQEKGPLVLDIPRLELPTGGKVFIKGASGSGKSTLLNLIAGVILPETGGKVTVANTELTKLSSAQRDRFRANHIGFIFQLFNLVPYLSVLENVTLPLMFSEARANRLQASPKQVAKTLLQDLGLPKNALGRKVTELSIGQQQRVAAARAIIGYPPLLVADEPTSALDADTQDRFVRLLFEACNKHNMTLLFVSHNAGLETLFDSSFSLTDLNQSSKQKQVTEQGNKVSA